MVVGLVVTSSPSANFTPRISFGNWLPPSRRRQARCAASTSLKTMASAVLLERQPFERMVRWRTVANVLSIGFLITPICPLFRRERLILLSSSTVCGGGDGAQRGAVPEGPEHGRVPSALWHGGAMPFRTCGNALA